MTYKQIGAIANMKMKDDWGNILNVMQDSRLATTNEGNMWVDLHSE